MKQKKRKQRTINISRLNSKSGAVRFGLNQIFFNVRLICGPGSGAYVQKISAVTDVCNEYN